MEQVRKSGILMHISSLPGAHGIGDLGQSAEWFIDFLQRTGQRVWQVLPLTPPATGNSPYGSLSAFASNPLFISLSRLVDEGLLHESDLHGTPGFSRELVEYDRVHEFKDRLLRRSYERFSAAASQPLRTKLESFVDEQRWWLDDFALFQALFESHQGTAWNQWEQELVHREEDAIRAWRERLATRIEEIQYIQFVFHEQWQRLKAYAHDRAVSIMGDLPIFVAYQSADVWSHQDLFQLDEDRAPTVVAGVPPDYFSETGQLWGNPLYNWQALADEGYQWWIRRVGHSMSLFDMIRLDHFRGFHSYWEVPADADTAIHGKWVEGPGERLFGALRDKLGPLPLVAEDLGMISTGVHALRENLGLPGMRVLQFAFGEGDKVGYHRPDNYPRNCVAYTGTHDNDTIVGWFRGRPETSDPQHDLLLKSLGNNGEEIHWSLIRLTLSSAADLAIIPLQDILGLDSTARMNLPGSADGNWTWRVREDMLQPEIESRLRMLTETCGRTH